MMDLPRKDENGKNYISYSQHSKWKKSKKEYIKMYFFGEKFDGNEYTEFGSTIGEALENNDFSAFNSVEKKTLKKVTRLDEFEREIKWDFKDFYVKGYIDTNDKDCKVLIDYKTGDLGKVSVYESDVYDQLAIYAGAIEQETGTLPEEAHVELIERIGNAFRGEDLALGKEVVKIPQDISPKKIEKVKKEVVKIATEIAEHYEVFNKMNSILI
jgi:hypothetical protein